MFRIFVLLAALMVGFPAGAQDVGQLSDESVVVATGYFCNPSKGKDPVSFARNQARLIEIGYTTLETRGCWLETAIITNYSMKWLQIAQLVRPNGHVPWYVVMVDRKAGSGGNRLVRQILIFRPTGDNFTTIYLPPRHRPAVRPATSAPKALA